MYDYDWLVIGSGPAGEKGAVQAAYFGKRVAVIEKERVVGGACINTGTLPSKTLRETAIYISGYRNREMYGLSCNIDASFSVNELMCRQDPVIQGEQTRLRENLRRHNVDLISGTATFVDEHTVEIVPASGVPRRVTADAILVAVGSSPYRPAFVPFEDPAVDDSDTILQLPTIPSELVVLGGGVIGCEYGSLFAALGTKVTIIEGRDQILGFLDGEINRLLHFQLQKLGCEILLQTTVSSIARHGDGLVLTLHDGRELGCQRVLFAGGRAGNTRSLGLDRIGVQVDSRGLLKTDAQGRLAGTASGRVFAAGDVVGFPSLASVAMEQGRVAACHAFGFQYKQRVAENFPYGLYTLPEVSMIGETEESCRQKGIDYEVGRASYRGNARGQIVGDLEGVVKLIFAVEDKRLLGVHILGERATELIHIGQAVLHFGGTIDDFIDQVFNFPTLSELYKYAAYDGLGRKARRATSVMAAVRAE